MRKPPHTTVRHNTLWVRMYVPEDVRGAFDGKKLFLERIGPWPMDYHVALAASSAWIAGWKKKIGQAKEAPDWVEFMTEYDDQGADDVLAIMTEDELRDTARLFLASLKNKKPLVDAAQAVAASVSKTEFLQHLKEWQDKTHLKGKTLDQAISDIKQFSAAVSETLESLSGRHVQDWIEKLLETVSADTVRRKLSALKSYWGWLQAHEYISPDRTPFDGRKIQDKRTKVEKALDKRRRFEREEVSRLINESVNDQPLQALIRLAAFTGERREGLASSKRIQSLRWKESSRYGYKKRRRLGFGMFLSILRSLDWSPNW